MILHYFLLSIDIELMHLFILYLLHIYYVLIITLVSRIEVPVRLFFFAFFPQPVCLIRVYVFIIFF